MDNQELKDFIALAMGQLTQEISRLTANVERQSLTIREIDIKTTTRIAELQKDVEEIRHDIQETRGELRDLGESQKFRWRTLDDERKGEKKDRESKDRIQAIKNDRLDTTNKLLWAIFSIVLALAISFVWELIKNGGLRGLVIP